MLKIFLISYGVLTIAGLIVTLIEINNAPRRDDW